MYAPGSATSSCCRVGSARRRRSASERAARSFAARATIQELRETVEILELKIKKLEQLVRLKESMITTLNSKLHQHGVQ